MVKYKQDQISTVFQALADPTRRHILERLALTRPSVLELAKPFDMSLPAVSKHLKVLEKAGLIQRRKKGRFNYFEIITKPVEDATEWIEAYEIYWKKRLIALDEYLINKGRSKQTKGK